ncbi:MAG: c-type cytochrome [Candidatus Omnitrophica bacterium]|nr:c-type cytochrome [Candidatus Omnitrophota bacterium]
MSVSQSPRWYLRLPVAFAAAWLVWGAPAVCEPAERPAPDLEAGQAAYLQHCARCHGASGKGDGLDAKRFYPRPRDLTMGVYKFRSTVSGTPPTDDDLFRTITQGLPGTNMPDWAHLDEAARWQLVEYLKRLAPLFDEATPQPITVPPGPGRGQADLKRGRAVYERLGCAACHGGAGRANGTSAGGFVDDWGMPIRPANLTQGWSYRGGSDPQAVLTRILSGIDGTGMPSYAEALPPEDAWPLAHYVASLQEPPHWNMIAHPLAVEGALPATLDDPRWDRAERTDVRLRNVVTPAGEWANPPTVKAISFQAVANAEGLAFRLAWDDPTQDGGAPPDGVAVILKPAGSAGDVVTLQVWPYEDAPPLDICYWAADTGKAFEAVAASFEPVRARSTPRTMLESLASYEDGRWRALLRRSLHPATPAGAAAIEPNGFTAVAFAVWDGGNPGARAVSPWTDLALRQEQ